MTACRYCHSPVRGNPCWFLLDHPDYAMTGADAPCVNDERWEAEERAEYRRWYIFLALLALFLSAGVYRIFYG